MKRLVTIAICATLLHGSVCASAVTRTWTGNVNSNWATAGNWSPSGVPNDGDDLIFNQAGNNTSIQNVPTLRLNSFTISTTGAPVSYSFISATSRTLSLSGTGNCFTVGQNCTLTTSSNMNIEMGDWGAPSSMLINGTFIMNGTLVFDWNTGQLTLGCGGTLTVSGVLTYNTSGGLTVNGTLNLTNGLTIPWSGTQLTVNSSGTLNVHGPILYQASGDATINGTLITDDSFTVPFSSSNLTVGPGGSLNVANDFVYQSSGNINVNGTMTINSMEIPYTTAQIAIGTNGSLTVNGPLSYNSSKDFINNGNGTFHLNGTYNSDAVHTVMGTGSVLVDPGKTMTMNKDLIIEGNFTVFGTLVVPVSTNLRVNGLMTLRPG